MEPGGIVIGVAQFRMPSGNTVPITIHYPDGRSLPVLCRRCSDTRKVDGKKCRSCKDVPRREPLD